MPPRMTLDGRFLGFTFLAFFVKLRRDFFLLIFLGCFMIFSGRGVSPDSYI